MVERGHKLVWRTCLVVEHLGSHLLDGESCPPRFGPGACPCGQALDFVTRGTLWSGLSAMSVSSPRSTMPSAPSPPSLRVRPWRPWQVSSFVGMLGVAGRQATRKHIDCPPSQHPAPHRQFGRIGSQHLKGGQSQLRTTRIPSLRSTRRTRSMRGVWRLRAARRTSVATRPWARRTAHGRSETPVHASMLASVPQHCSADSSRLLAVESQHSRTAIYRIECSTQLRRRTNHLHTPLV